MVIILNSLFVPAAHMQAIRKAMQDIILNVSHKTVAVVDTTTILPLKYVSEQKPNMTLKTKYKRGSVTEDFKRKFSPNASAKNTASKTNATIGNTAYDVGRAQHTVTMKALKSTIIFKQTQIHTQSVLNLSPFMRLYVSLFIFPICPLSNRCRVLP